MRLAFMAGWALAAAVSSRLTAAGGGSEAAAQRLCAVPSLAHKEKNKASAPTWCRCLQIGGG
jgi:hypothetical protein